MSNRKRRTSSLSSLSLRILSKYGTLYRPGKFLIMSQIEFLTQTYDILVLIL